MKKLINKIVNSDRVIPVLLLLNLVLIPINLIIGNHTAAMLNGAAVGVFLAVMF